VPSLVARASTALERAALCRLRQRATVCPAIEPAGTESAASGTSVLNEIQSRPLASGPVTVIALNASKRSASSEVSGVIVMGGPQVSLRWWISVARNGRMMQRENAAARRLQA
jgi:hypothetical protein